ncbi:MAG: hypothetical protein KIS62_00775 [Ramlibacter sp.]|nr:hypothetical protein [Ramlibacter sp.]
MTDTVNFQEIVPPTLLPESIVWTPEIERLNDFLVQSIRMQLSGCAVYGGQRFGKTTALKYLAQLLPKTLGYAVPWVSWSIRRRGSRDITDLAFLKQRMTQTQPLSLLHRDEAVLESRLHNALIDLGRSYGCRMVIISVDEAQNLDQTGYAHLIYAYNALESAGIRPFFLMVGQPELKHARKTFKEMQAYQVIGRFFCRMHVYRGIRRTEIAEVLAAFDEEYPDGERVSSRLFEQVAGSDWTFAQWAPQFQEAIAHIVRAHNLPPELTLPMQYLRSSLLKVLIHCDAERTDPRLVHTATVLRAIRASGFLSSLAYCVEECELKDPDDFDAELTEPLEETA